MDDFHNQIKWLFDPKTISIHFLQPMNNPIIDQRDNKERTHPIHKRSRPEKPSENNRKENQEGLPSKSNQKTEQISHPLLFTPPLVIDMN